MTLLFNLLKYIPIHTDSLQKYEGQIAPINNEYLFLFDIDDTLYKMCREMNKMEYDTFYHSYKKLNKGENISMKKFKELLHEPPMFGAGLYNKLNKSAKEVENERGLPVDFYTRFIPQNDDLRNALQNLPFRKWCFTNGLACRAKGILTALNIEDCFEGVICIDDTEMGEKGKPSDFAYNFVEKLLGITNKEKVYFFDDNLLNFKKAEKFGWNAILVEKESDIITLINDVRRSIIAFPEH